MNCCTVVGGCYSVDLALKLARPSGCGELSGVHQVSHVGAQMCVE